MKRKTSGIEVSQSRRGYNTNVGTRYTVNILYRAYHLRIRLVTLLTIFVGRPISVPRVGRPDFVVAADFFRSRTGGGGGWDEDEESDEVDATSGFVMRTGATLIVSSCSSDGRIRFFGMHELCFRSEILCVGIQTEYGLRLSPLAATLSYPSETTGGSMFTMYPVWIHPSTRQ